MQNATHFGGIFLALTVASSRYGWEVLPKIKLTAKEEKWLSKKRQR
jgi:hypothetical protein